MALRGVHNGPKWCKGAENQIEIYYVSHLLFAVSFG